MMEWETANFQILLTLKEHHLKVAYIQETK